jgi:hypothetical protein
MLFIVIPIRLTANDILASLHRSPRRDGAMGRGISTIIIFIRLFVNMGGMNLAMKSCIRI